VRSLPFWGEYKKHFVLDISLEDEDETLRFDTESFYHSEVYFGVMTKKMIEVKFKKII
jgi:hypothetical protein